MGGMQFCQFLVRYQRFVEGGGCCAELARGLDGSHAFHGWKAVLADDRGLKLKGCDSPDSVGGLR